nr:uncharacterized protein LOC109172450 isoform X1 [Ipomoea batatas]
MDVTREELPETMAAVRLSGMEISDLTMELSDLGGKAATVYKHHTIRLTVFSCHLRPLAFILEIVLGDEFRFVFTLLATTQAPMQTKTAGPAVARKARGIREGIVKGRAALQMLFTLSRYSGMAFNFFSSRAKVRG